ncbi:MAG: phage holin family protein [Verrucomicrobiia bacterium]
MKDLPWSPPFLDHHEEVSPHLQEVFDAFPSKGSYLNEANLKTIYIPTSESWGVITEPTVGGALDIRLTNKITENLKQACDEVVAGLIDVASRRRNRSTFKLQFRAIQILGSESDTPIYIGEAVEDHLLKTALREQKLEALIGAVAFGFALVFLWLSSPSADWLLSFLRSPQWSNWVANIIGQFSVAALVISFVSLLKIILYALDLRKRRPIRWRLS